MEPRIREVISVSLAYFSQLQTFAQRLFSTFVVNLLREEVIVTAAT